MKSIIIYYSNSGTTEKIALQLKECLSCDIVKIEPQIPYGAYFSALKRATAERKSKTVAEYHAPVVDLTDTDTIFVGYPLWYSEAPAFVLDYLKKYDLTGKTIIPFSTSGASHIKNSLPTLQEAVGKAEIKNPFNCGKFRKDNFDSWVKNIQI